MSKIKVVENQIFNNFGFHFDLIFFVNQRKDEILTSLHKFVQCRILLFFVLDKAIFILKILIFEVNAKKPLFKIIAYYVSADSGLSFGRFPAI